MKSKFVPRSSSVVRRSFVRLWSIDYRWSNCMDFFQILVVVSVFFSFLKFLFNFFRVFFVFVKMGPYGSKSKRYSSHKSQPKALKLFLNFLPNGPHKTTCMFGVFVWEVKFKRFFVFFNMGPYESENFRLKGKIEFGIFEILKIEFLTNYIRFGEHGTQIGETISKRYSSYKWQPNVLKLVLNFPPYGSH